MKTVIKHFEFNDEHRFKLMTMANHLFPDYDFEVNHMREKLISYGHNDDKIYSGHIGWYEFMNTWIVSKLLTPNKGLKVANHHFIKQYMWESNLYWYNTLYSPTKGVMNYGRKHPVDYLYEIYEELKL